MSRKQVGEKSLVVVACALQWIDDKHVRGAARGVAQLIREAEQSEDEVKRSAELDRLERLIKHFAARTTMLLEVAQISSKKIHFNPSELNLSDVIYVIVNE
jgi:hypothetical protein